MTDPRTDEDRIRGIVQAASMDPIPTANEYNIQTKDKEQINSVASGSSETVTFTPPAGKVWLVINAVCSAPLVETATSGTHQVAIYQGTSRMGLYAKAPYGERAAYSYGTLKGSSERRPRSDMAANLVIQNLVITPSLALTMYYSNNTDAAKVNSRYYTLLYQEVRKTI